MPGLSAQSPREASGPDRWVMKPKTFIGLTKTKSLAELRSAGVSESAIA